MFEVKNNTNKDNPACKNRRNNSSINARQARKIEAKCNCELYHALNEPPGNRHHDLPPHQLAILVSVVSLRKIVSILIFGHDEAVEVENYPQKKKSWEKHLNA